MSFFKKLFGIADEPKIKPIKPGEGEETIADLEYELAKRKAREAREQQDWRTPGSSTEKKG